MPNEYGAGAHGSYDRRERNMGKVERWLWGSAGGALMVAGARTRNPVGRIALATIGAVMMRGSLTGHSWAYDRLGINSAGLEHGEGVNLEASIVIDRPRHEVYEFWRDLERLPHFMQHVADVRVMPDGVSHWEAIGPAKLPVSWDARIIDDRPAEMLSWESLPGSLVQQAGSVHFADADAGHGTRVRVKLRYAPPAGAAGLALAKVLRTLSEGDLATDLGRLKRLLESGRDSIATSPPTHGQRRWIETRSSEQRAPSTT